MSNLFLQSPSRRLALAGDWHGHLTWAVEAVKVAASEGASTIVHLGDFGYQFADHYLNALDSALTKHDMVLGFVDGNHENHDWLDAQPIDDNGLRSLRERVFHIPRGFSWEWYGINCMGLGGAHSVDRPVRTPGHSWWSREWISDGELSIAKSHPYTDVMFTHDCPAGVDIPAIRTNPNGFPQQELDEAHVHRELLREVFDVVKPKTVYHGHYHDRYDSHLFGEGYTTNIHGLDCNGKDKKMEDNLVVMNLEELIGWRSVIA